MNCDSLGAVNLKTMTWQIWTITSSSSLFYNEIITEAAIVCFCFFGHYTDLCCIPTFTLHLSFAMRLHVRRDLWNFLNKQTKEKRKDERLNCIGDPSLEHQTELFSQQSVGLRGDRVVISWQRGAGHVGTTRLTSKTDWLYADCTRTLFVCLSDVPLFFFCLSLHSLSALSPSWHQPFCPTKGIWSWFGEMTCWKREKVWRVKWVQNKFSFFKWNLF